MFGLISKLVTIFPLFGAYFLTSSVKSNVTNFMGATYTSLMLENPIMRTLFWVTFALFFAVIFFETIAKYTNIAGSRFFLTLLQISLPMVFFSTAIFFGYLQYQRHSDPLYKVLKSIQTYDQIELRKEDGIIKKGIYKEAIRNDRDFLQKSVDNGYSKVVYKDIFSNLKNYLNSRKNSSNLPLIFYVIESGNETALEVLLDYQDLTASIEIPSEYKWRFFGETQKANPYQWAKMRGKTKFAKKILKASRKYYYWRQEMENDVDGLFSQVGNYLWS